MGNFDDAILFGCVQLADRYLVGSGKYVSGSQLQGVVMACLCTTLKLQTADSLTYSVPTLLAHIAHNQISLDRVLRVEREDEHAQMQALVTELQEEWRLAVTP